MGPTAAHNSPAATSHCHLVREELGPETAVPPPPPEVGSRLGPAPAQPRRPPEAVEARTQPAHNLHVRVPSEGVGDVLHHPLHQHRHLFARLGHVGSGHGSSGAPPGERRAAGGSSAGSARVCAGLAALPPPPLCLRPAPAPAPAPAAEHFRFNLLAAGAWPSWRLSRCGYPSASSRYPYPVTPNRVSQRPKRYY